MIDKQYHPRRHHRPRLFLARKRGVEQLEPLSFDGRRRRALDGLLEQAVERPRAQGVVTGLLHLVDRAENLSEPVPLLRIPPPAARSAGRTTPPHVLLQFRQPRLHFAAGMVKIEFVSYDNTRTVFLQDGARDFAFLRRHAARRIHHQRHYIRPADAALRPGHAVGFHIRIDLRLLPDTCRINQQIGTLPAVIVETVDAVACRPGHVAHNAPGHHRGWHCRERTSRRSGGLQWPRGWCADPFPDPPPVLPASLRAGRSSVRSF